MLLFLTIMVFLMFPLVVYSFITVVRIKRDLDQTEEVLRIGLAAMPSFKESPK